MTSDLFSDFDWEAFMEQDFNTAFDIQLPNDGSDCSLLDLEYFLGSDPSTLTGDFPDVDLQLIAPEQQTDRNERCANPMDEISASNEKPVNPLDHTRPTPNQSWGSSSIEDVEVPAAEYFSVCRGQDAANEHKDQTTAKCQPSDWIDDPPDLYTQIDQLRKEITERNTKLNRHATYLEELQSWTAMIDDKVRWLLSTVQTGEEGTQTHVYSP